jgi:heptaprenyl diphosphate synthase
MGNLGLPQIDSALEAQLTSQMAKVEEFIKASIEGEYPFAVETSQHLISAGGKRIRPLLTLLASHFGPERAANEMDIIKAAIVCELTHVATLYHDDVMDEAPRRRGVESANKRWGNTIAILTGDYIFSKTSQILAELGPDAVNLQAKTFERLVIGQINETVAARDGKRDLETYLKVIADKTASLLSTSARFGAIFSGCSAADIEALANYGEEMGLIFQLADDIIDIQSSSEQSGKTQGTDLKEGIPTLVTLLILNKVVPASDWMIETLSGPIEDDAVLEKVLKELRDHEAIQVANEMVNKRAEQARSYLKQLPNCPAKEALAILTSSVIDRTA